MKLIRKFIHQDASNLEGKEIYERVAARAIVVVGEEILLMYTARYNDFSFPGGGVDENEDIQKGMIRELEEETGATGIEMVSKYGIYEEIKPIWKKEYDFIHMISHFYICKADRKLGKNQLEDYEVNNGMDARWVNIHDAIAHNKAVIEAQPESIGLYIDRELYMLELVAKELIRK